MKGWKITQAKADRIWLSLMKLGERAGCHQKPERSFCLWRYQFPVCARCTGVILGYILAVPGSFLFGFSKLVALAGSMILFVDWFLQTLKIKESTNTRRILSGVCGGYALMLVQLQLIKVLLFKMSARK